MSRRKEINPETLIHATFSEKGYLAELELQIQALEINLQRKQRKRTALIGALRARKYRHDNNQHS